MKRLSQAGSWKTEMMGFVRGFAGGILGVQSKGCGSNRRGPGRGFVGRRKNSGPSIQTLYQAGEFFQVKPG